MGNYKVLSSPIYSHAIGSYKGVYRREPFPKSRNSAYFSLWERASKYIEPLQNMGITDELTLRELIEYAKMASEEIGEPFEVIYFDEKEGCPHDSVFYGIDVIEKNGYSMLCAGKVNEQVLLANELNCLLGEKLNANGLFGCYEDGVRYRDLINKMRVLFPGIVEDQDLYIVFVYKVFG